MSMMPDNPKRKAAQSLDDMIAQFKSPEQKRIALRKALAKRPDDARLQQAWQRLNGAEFVRTAVDQGIYISYSRSDELFALDLADALRKANIAAWLDVIDIEDDLDWEGEVRAALNRSGLIIVILSPEALADETLAAEWSQLEEAGKLALPVLRRHCDLPRSLAWLPPVDFSHEFERGFHTLLPILQGKSLNKNPFAR